MVLYNMYYGWRVGEIELELKYMDTIIKLIFIFCIYA